MRPYSRPDASRPDLADLAGLARSADPALRPLLLQVQAASFASAPVRGRDALLRFESLALGLIPFATSDVLTSVATLLRRLPDPPERILSAIAERLGDIVGPPCAADEILPLDQARLPDIDPATLADLLALANDPVDLALARNSTLMLGGASLDLLVERARSRGTLAIALHERPEPTLFDRAALYRFGTSAQRGQLRSSLAEGAARSHHLPGTLGSIDIVDLDRAATAEDPVRFTRILTDGLGLDGLFGTALHTEVDAELVALALVALGVEASEAIRMFLALDPRIACSVGAIFGLAEILRNTPRVVAYEVLYCAASRLRATSDKRPRPREELHAVDRVRRVSFGIRPLQARPAASAPADRPWRATTGRDRT